MSYICCVYSTMRHGRAKCFSGLGVSGSGIYDVGESTSQDREPPLGETAPCLPNAAMDEVEGIKRPWAQR